jgi:hypothetical protein
VTLLGVDPLVLELGLRAVERNQSLRGIWATEHDAALLASLRLGCCAFPDAREPLRDSALAIYSELPPGGLPEGIRGLDVRFLQREGDRLMANGLDAEWQSWLRALGFEVQS